MKDIKVPWELDPNFRWNDACAKITERFGLPGYKYHTRLDSDGINFNFNDERDALLCQIMISEQI